MNIKDVKLIVIKKIEKIFSDSGKKIVINENQNFEDIGLGSMLYIQLIVLIEQELSIEFDDLALDVNYFSSIKEMAEYIVNRVS